MVIQIIDLAYENAHPESCWFSCLVQTSESFAILLAEISSKTLGLREWTQCQFYQVTPFHVGWVDVIETAPHLMKYKVWWFSNFHTSHFTQNTSNLFRGTVLDSSTQKIISSVRLDAWSHVFLLDFGLMLGIKELTRNWRFRMLFFWTTGHGQNHECPQGWRMTLRLWGLIPTSSPNGCFQK